MVGALEIVFWVIPITTAFLALQTPAGRWLDRKSPGLCILAVCLGCSPMLAVPLLLTYVIRP